MIVVPDEHRALLVHVAHALIQPVATQPAVFPFTHGHFKCVTGCFVTWKRDRDGQLRGCIGSVERGERDIADLATSLALAAAERDPRFSPILPHEYPELRLGITLLGEETPWPVPRSAPDLDTGEEGVRVCRGEHEAVLLPQVAREWGFDAARFLAAVCEKAGLADEAWSEPDVEVFRFRAIELSAPYRDLLEEHA